MSFAFVNRGWVYNEKTIVFTFDKYRDFSVLQSDVHTVWAWNYSSTMRNAGINYAPSDCVETFPFPKDVLLLDEELEDVGHVYHEHRRQIMLARQEGLTTTYNRFHNPEETAADIARLRQLHVEMDQAVAAAYGWGDLALDHGFHETAQGVRFTISEAARREVLDRLLALNHERYEEEIKAGLHEKGKGKRQGRKRSAQSSLSQLRLFGEKPE